MTWSWNWLTKESGIAQDLNQRDGIVLHTAFVNACRARDLATGDPDLENLDPDLLLVLDSLLRARMMALQSTLETRQALVGVKGVEQQDAALNQIDKEIGRLIRGLSKPQAVGAYILMCLSAALEIVLTGFTSDKSLVVRSLPLGFSNLTASFGQLLHKGASLAQFATVLLPQRVITGLPGRIDVLIAAIDKQFGMDLARYLPSNLVPTFFLMAICYGVPLWSRLAHNARLSQAITTYGQTTATHESFTEELRQAADRMEDAKEGLKATGDFLDNVLAKADIGKVSQAGFARVVSAVVNGQRNFDLARALTIRAERRKLPFVKRTQAALLDFFKKSGLGIVWLTIIGSLMVATIGNNLQLTTQALVVLGAHTNCHLLSRPRISYLNLHALGCAGC